MEELIKIFLSDGRGPGYGYGYGSGRSSGRSPGHGYGYGSGRSSGRGNGYGDGTGFGRGNGIQVVNGRCVYHIDDVPTLIYKVHIEDAANGFAVGRILHVDLTTEITYIAKRGYEFAHGATLNKAIQAVNDKALARGDVESRISAFVEKFPLIDTFVNGEELFRWHNILTGSCLQGRNAFVRDRGLSLDDEYTIIQFLALTEDSYGGDIIKALKERYMSMAQQRGGGNRKRRRI